jgi:hypothetical protein
MDKCLIEFAVTEIQPILLARPQSAAGPGTSKRRRGKPPLLNM